MIYLFAGEDAKEKLKAYKKFIKSLPQEVESFFVSRNDFDKGEMERFYSGSGLFSSKSAIFYENIFEREEVRDFVLNKLGKMAQSENLFVFLESKLSKSTIDSFKKAKAEINIFELFKVKGRGDKKEKFNSFLLANAFGEKDKLNLWVYFRQAINNGVAMEEMIGILFWKVKDMILKRNFSKFTEAELKTFASRISYLLPEARKKGLDAEASFEQFLLEAF